MTILTSTIVPLLALSTFSHAQETVVGAYIFHRHGDRTPKTLPPANLTTLGYNEVYNSGIYYRNRYVASNASSPIFGLSPDVVNNEQIAMSAPADTVLENSAQAFTQALYPAVGASMSTETLANGSDVAAPLGGYQLIPIGQVASGAGSEDSGWLQASSDCGNAKTASNAYFYSPDYMTMLDQTMDFYKMLRPIYSSIFNESSSTFKNAYTIFDFINVAHIHNQTITSGDLLTDAAFQQLGNLANIHEYNLAYNASNPIGAIAGKQLAAQVVNAFAALVDAAGDSDLLSVQFGNYATMQSYFGLAQLAGLPGSSFPGIPDYASSLVWELFTTAPVSAGSFPAASDLQVRFLFHNGSASAASPPVQYPLFGTGRASMPWTDFMTQTGMFSVGTTQQWCTACGNTTGTCAQYASGESASSSSSPSSSSSGGSGISLAVAGVIGAMVTLAVILLIEAFILLVGGFRLVSKKRMAQGRSALNGANGNGKA